MAARTPLPRETRTYLRTFLTERFSLVELQTLAFDLALDWDTIARPTKDETVLSLITYYERHDDLACLVFEILKQRPNDQLAALLPTLHPCAGRELVIIAINADTYQKAEIQAILARLTQTAPDAVAILGSHRGSLHLLVGLPAPAAHRLLQANLGELNTPYAITSLVAFADLHLSQKLLWRTTTLLTSARHQASTMLGPTLRETLRELIASSRSARWAPASNLGERLEDRRSDKALTEQQATLRDDWDTLRRIHVLLQRASNLPETERTDAFRHALIATRAMQNDYYRAHALAALASHLSLGLIPDALAATLAIDNSLARVEALTALAPHLPPDLLPEALVAARTIQGEYERTRALAALAPHLPEPERNVALREALVAARVIKTEIDRVQVLTALAPYLPPDLLPEALAAARAIQDEAVRAQGLTDLASHLPEPQRSAVLVEALAAVRAIKYDYLLAEALANLAPHLPPDLLPEALDVALTIDNPNYRVRTLAAIAAALDRRPPDDTS